MVENVGVVTVVGMSRLMGRLERHVRGSAYPNGSAATEEIKILYVYKADSLLEKNLFIVETICSQS